MDGIKDPTTLHIICRVQAIKGPQSLPTLQLTYKFSCIEMSVTSLSFTHWLRLCVLGQPIRRQSLEASNNVERPITCRNQVSRFFRKQSSFSTYPYHVSPPTKIDDLQPHQNVFFVPNAHSKVILFIPKGQVTLPSPKEEKHVYLRHLRAS